MEELFKQFALNSPALAAVLLLCFFFFKYLKSKDTISKELADSCHKSHENLFNELKSMREENIQVIRDNTVAAAESSNASKEVRKAIERLTFERKGKA